MKRILAAAAVFLTLAGVAGSAEAQSRRTRVIQTQPSGIDINTLLLLGTLGGADAGMAGILPLLALQGQGSTTVIERGGRRWRGPRPAPTSRSR